MKVGHKIPGWLIYSCINSRYMIYNIHEDFIKKSSTSDHQLRIVKVMTHKGYKITPSTCRHAVCAASACTAAVTAACAGPLREPLLAAWLGKHCWSQSESWWQGDWLASFLVCINQTGNNNPVNYGYNHEIDQVSYNIIRSLYAVGVNFMEARPGSTKKLQTAHRPPCFQRRDHIHLQHGLHQTVVFDLRRAKESTFV